jgi:hypothetical protein
MFSQVSVHTLSVRLWLAADRTRCLARNALLGLVSLLLSRTALADDDIFGMINHVTEGVSSVSPGLVKAAGVGGIALGIIGLVMLAQKKNNPHIKGGQIAICLIVAAALICFNQFMKRVQATAGLQPVDMG